MRIYLAPNQWQVLLCIVRKTYGFKKKVDWIANFQIVEATGLVKSTVSRALRALEHQNIIIRNGKSIGFQKDWEQWEKLAEQSTKVSNLANNEKLAEQSTELAEQSTELAEQSTKVSNPFVTQKKKETIQKKLYKRKYGEFQNVLLADEEYQKLQEKFGNQVSAKIETLSSGIESKGYKYKSHYATILNWSRRDELKGVQNGEHKGNPSQKPAGAFSDIES